MQPMIYVVDDDSSVRNSLVFLMKVSGYATEDFSCGEDFLALDIKGPGCILLDVNMSGMNGLQVQEALKARGNTLPIIFITAFSDVPRIVQATKDGAEDFLIKPVDGEVLIARIQQALNKCSVPVDGADQMYSEAMARVDCLTDREREVFLLSMEGLSCKNIGLKLALSYRTVEIHRSRICAKLEVANLAEFICFAAKLDKFSTLLLSPTSP